MALAWGGHAGLAAPDVGRYAPLDYDALWRIGRMPLLICLAGTFAFGQLQLRQAQSRRRTRGRDAMAEVGELGGEGDTEHSHGPQVPAASHATRDDDELVAVDPRLLRREIEALTVANRTLQNRVSGQPDSITYLYTRLSELYSQNVQRALEVVLDSVRFFTRAQKVSVWQYDRGEQRLIARARHGWDAESDAERPSSLPADQSIEDWVARNNQRFSVKMLLHYDNLRRIDQGNVIYAFPVTAGRSVWGVLDVESLPFEHFNTYTEQMLLLILALAAPALEQALEYESNIVQPDVNSETGLPEFGQFNRLLVEQVERRTRDRTTVSILNHRAGKLC